ncbi:hypothetical protein HDV03_001466 [Kappamyces sp. JEL0829]|nr:hypothetical protein HDV03_001466 [Kappamyces sp. JEL0829]
MLLLFLLASSVVGTLLLSAYLFLLTLEQTGFIDAKDPNKWRGLPSSLLYVITKIIAYVLPYRVTNDAGDLKGSKVIFVCNHQLGAMEVPALFSAIYSATGVYPRGLADRFHYLIPIHKQMITVMGGILGDRALCSRAMEAGYPLLVFPGGSDEVLRSKKTPRYSLQWKERKGFARLALEHGYTIVPVSSIGGDEQFWIWFEFPLKLVFRLIGDKRSQKDLVFPVFLPNLQFQYQYIRLGNQIDTSQFHDNRFDEAIITSLRDQTRDELHHGFEVLKKQQSGDPDRFLGLARRWNKPRTL